MGIASCNVRYYFIFLSYLKNKLVYIYQKKSIMYISFFYALRFNISILNGAKFKAWMKLLLSTKNPLKNTFLSAGQILKQKNVLHSFFPIHKVIVLLYSTFFSIDTRK